MNGLLSFALDLTLIGMLAAGIFYAMRLSRQLAGLRASRVEMERFVLDFSATVQRAEAGIHGLKHAARTGGDDLEQLIEKAQSLRDELHFLVDSADQIASRLSDTASVATRLSQGSSGAAASKTATEPQPKTAAPANAASERKAGAASSAPSAAERDLLQALEKLG